VDEDRYFRRFARQSLSHTGAFAPIDQMGITAKNQAVFVFLSVGLAQAIIEFSSSFTL